MKYCNYFVTIFFVTVITHNVFSQVIPSYRAADWTKAGYNGTIPVYSTVKNIIDFGGNGNDITPNDLALQNAIASLNGQDGIVYFPGGTFLFNSTVNLRGGIVLKGEGATNTTLKFNLAGSGTLVSVAGSAVTDSAKITVTALKGDTSIVVDNASRFNANDYVKIYQNDDALVNDSWALRSVGQITRIKNINDNTIYFSSPLRRNYSLINVPKIQRLNLVQGTGIECLKIKRMDVAGSLASNFLFSNAANCWIRGVESDSCNFAHVRISNSTNIEVTNNYFHGAFDYGEGGKGYGITCEFTSGECLIENNIFKHLRHSMLLQTGANGNVFDYNYSLEPFKTEELPSDLSGDIVLHGNYPYLNLFEGNIVQNIVIDASHGINGPHNTLLRNRAESYGILISSGAGDSINIIGNEISGTGFLKGNFYIQGSGNLLYANNRNGTIIPAENTTLTDRSYVYNNTASFWNIGSLWPSVGLPNTIRSGTIPAKERYLTGNFTYCLPQVAVYTFTGNGNWDIADNWSNGLVPPSVLSTGSEIIIDAVAGGKCILNIPVTINPGVKLTVGPGNSFEVQSNLLLIK